MGAATRWRCPATLSDALKAFGRRQGATLYMTLLAAFQVLLHRYSGQDDIAVGSPVTLRGRTELEGLIGFFVNTLVMRTNLAGNPTFQELLARVREVTLGAYAHQDLPFENLLEELRPERHLTRTPLFQNFFNMLGPEEADPSLHNLALIRFPIHNIGSNFDTTMYVSESGGRIELSLVYRAELFQPDTARDMLQNYRNLLEGIAEDPERAISSYSLLRLYERRHSFGQPNPIETPRSFVAFERRDIEQGIGARFSRQAHSYPDHVAVKTKAHVWTYAELNSRANRIAHALLRRFGNGGERISLLFGHGAPMIAAILGVLKSGNAYVPLDTHSSR